jgi:hypothetical protein
MKQSGEFLTKINFAFAGKNYSPAIIISSLLLLLFALLTYLSNGTYGGGDDLHHYRISRYAFQYPAFLLDHWGKPLYTLLSSPFAQFGYFGARFYNVVAGIMAAYFSYLLARNLKVENSVLLLFFVIFTPIYASQIPTAMTEITGALFLAAAVYLYFANKPLWAAVVVSFLPFARTEGFLILPLFLAAFAIHRQWRCIPFLALGTLAYSLAGWSYYNDFFWVFTKIPYSSQSADIYGFSELFYYFDRTKRIWGIPLAVLFVPGLLKHLHELYKSRFAISGKPALEFLLVFLPLAGILLFHTLASFLGTGALALDRFMVMVIPGFAFFALKGYNLLERLISFNLDAVKLVLKMLVLVIVVRTAFHMYKFPVPYGMVEQVLDEAVSWIQEQSHHTNKIYYYQPATFMMLDIDPHDESRIREALPNPENPGEGVAAGGILIWDAQFSPNEGRLPLERVIESGKFEMLKTFKPLHPFTVMGGREFEVVVFQRLAD